jgi:hypothetical protein
MGTLVVCFGISLYTCQSSRFHYLGTCRIGVQALFFFFFFWFRLKMLVLTQRVHNTSGMLDFALSGEPHR